MHLRANRGEPLPALIPLDSGATQTYLSLADAEELGIDIDTLKPTKEPISAMGTEFDGFRSPDPIEVRVVPDTGQYWGPWLAISPVFGEPEERVLGLSDFFKHFEVTFESAASPPAVSLELL